jgi:hypothetical protein
MRARRVLPGNWRRQRAEDCSTRLLLPEISRARAQAKRDGQFQPSVPIPTSSTTRCGDSGRWKRAKASCSACGALEWHSVTTPAPHPQLRKDQLHLRPGGLQVIDLWEVDRQLGRSAVRRLDVAILRKKVRQHLLQKAVVVDLGITADGILDTF